MTKANTQTLEGIKADFEKLKEQMTPEVRSLFSLLLQLFDVVIMSIGAKATSRNSHLPPSQDPHRVKKKKKKGMKKGGQSGHKGNSLAMVSNPDHIEYHPANKCDDCGINLEGMNPNEISRHQVIDIEFKKTITEHRVEHKICTCGHHQANSVAGAPVQYGPGIKATAVELNQVQCVPLKRTAEFFQQKYDMSISPATLIAFSRQASERLRIWEEVVKAELLSSNVLHADETGINIDAENWWVHVLSSKYATLMIPHFNRGSDAMIETEVLPFFNGILIHDFWSSYNHFDVIHGPCHSHLQREFTKVYESYDQKWAKQLADLLVKANHEREENDGGLTYKRIRYYEGKYKKLINLAEKENPINTKRENERGAIAQSYPRKLLNRLINHKDWVLLFLYDVQVPFTNNQAERDIRMLKVQQKVSGCFRTEEGARDYCRIRSYILTMQKKGISKHEALTMLFSGT